MTRLRVHGLLPIAISGAITGTFLLAINQGYWLSLTGVILIGFSHAPIILCLISLTSKVVATHAASIIGFQISAVLIGAALFPSFAGLLTDYFCWEVIPLTFLAEGILLLTLVLISSRKHRNRDNPIPEPLL